MEHIEKQFLSQKHQSLLSSSGFTVHIQLPKSKWIAWFERHLFPYFFWQSVRSSCFPIIRVHRTTCLCANNVKDTKRGFQVTGLPQSAWRMSQGALGCWLLFRMSVCGGEHPGMQHQKWQLHLQIWLPRQQMPESLPWWPLGPRVPLLLWTLWEWRSVQQKNWKLWLSTWSHRKSLYVT